MLPTLEVRWFLPGAVPESVAAWFDALGEAVEAESRTDRYLVPVASDELGLKVREGRVEAKQRIGRDDVATWGQATAVPETWRKWVFGDIGDAELADRWIEVQKTRRQRWLRFDGAVCALELSTVGRVGETWWSICLETLGEREAGRQLALHAAARRWLTREDAPVLPADVALGYPAWLLGGPERDARR